MGEINLGFLKLGRASGSSRPPCVPVFEVDSDAAASTIERAKALGAYAVVEGEDHPDYPETAAVLIDPFGNEFQVTSYHE